MNNESKAWWLAFVVILHLPRVALAQDNVQNETFTIDGEPGEAKVLRIEGHEYVDLRDLARITNGSLSFQENRVVLTLPAPGAAPIAFADSNLPAEQERMTKDFMRAGVEATASMREWRSTLAHLLREGYPVGDQMVPYREKALDNLRLASVAASTPSDQRALQLLSNEFQNLSIWSKDLVNARNSGESAKYAMSDDAFSHDDLFQKIVQCSKFLGPMLASGNFGDDAACH